MYQKNNKIQGLINLKKTLLLLVLILSFILVGCHQQESSIPVQSEKVEKSVENEKIEVENQKVIKIVQEDPSVDISTKLSEFSIDIDEDGVAEKIVLYTSAERDTEGVMMWDDGQQWLLVVEKDTEYYTLFKGYIQLGQGYCEVYYDVSNTLNIDFIISTSMGIKITTFIYDKEQSVFIEKASYNSVEQNKIFSTIPSY